MAGASRGVVAAADPRAAEAGAAVLREGGSAVDAAVVAALVLYVVEPQSCGLGGDAFLLHVAPGRPPEALDGSGAVPRGLTEDRLREAGLDGVPGRGGPAVTVPGAVSLLEDALRRYGTISLSEAVEPALGYARDGYAVRPTLATAAGRAAGELADEPVLGPLFFPDGQPVRTGQIVKNPRLAAALEALSEEGPGVLYGGAIGAAVVARVQDDGGWLDLDDLRSHRTVPFDAEVASFRGTEVWELPTPTQGPAVLSALRTIEAAGDRPGWDLVVEAVDAGLREVGFDLHAMGPPPAPARGDTSYIATIDGAGRAASLITTVFGDFGGHLGVAELGGAIHNRAAMFRVTRTPPTPGEKPPHTTIPAAVTRGDRLAWVLGVAGGFMQPQAQVQILIRMLDERMLPQEAIDAPRFKILFGGDLALEEGHPLAAARPDAQGREPGPEGFGAVQVAGWSEGSLVAGADARRGGAVSFA